MNEQLIGTSLVSMSQIEGGGGRRLQTKSSLTQIEQREPSRSTGSRKIRELQRPNQGERSGHRASVVCLRHSLYHSQFVNSSQRPKQLYVEPLKKSLATVSERPRERGCTGILNIGLLNVMQLL